MYMRVLGFIISCLAGYNTYRGLEFHSNASIGIAVVLAITGIMLGMMVAAERIVGAIREKKG